MIQKLSAFNRDFYKLFFFQIGTTFLIATGLLDRVFVYCVLAILFAFFLTKPFKETLGMFIISLPFYLAIPAFESMSMWRPLSLLLILLWLWERRHILWQEPLRFWAELLQRKSLLLFTAAFGVFIFFATLSLWWAEDVFLGARAIIYFLNIFAVLFIYAWEVTKNNLLHFVKHAAVVSSTFLMVGFIQFIATFVVPLYTFWQWWALHPIAAFYGIETRNLVIYSNTWFSYYGEDLPATLRMFSLLQDSHAFAMITILGIALWGTLFFYYKDNGDKKGIVFSSSTLMISLLALILSGARGSWAGAGALLIIFLFLFLWKGSRPLILLRYGFSFLIIFFLLFPLASLLLGLEQKAQLILEGRGGEAANLRLAFLRARSLLDTEELSNKGRIEIWKDSLDFLITTKALSGTGMGNFPSVIELSPEKSRVGASAHSLYLQMLVELGIFGFLAFLFMLFLILKQAASMLKVQAYYAFSFLFAFSWILLYSFVDVTLLNDKVLLLLAFLIGVLYRKEVGEERFHHH